VHERTTSRKKFFCLVFTSGVPLPICEATERRMGTQMSRRQPCRTVLSPRLKQSPRTRHIGATGTSHRGSRFRRRRRRRNPPKTQIERPAILSQPVARCVAMKSSPE
jgi:hypothetical protein